MEPLKIGIVLNYKKAEMKKDELMSLNSRKMNWLKLGKNGDYSDYIIYRNEKPFVAADVAMGLYIEHTFPGVIVDYIMPNEISTRRFKKNDIVFVIIYDLLESFHLSDKDKFNKFKCALKNSKNVYPPYDYQKFINNKCIYYKYLANRNIPVAPTHCISRQKWYIKNPEKYVTNLLKKIKHNKWESVIAKPVYGQESKDFSKFLACDNLPKACKNLDCGQCGECGNKGKLSLTCQKGKMMKYFAKNIPKYGSIVMQEYIKGFDKSNPEIRTYFINGKYRYSIITTSTKVGRPVQEGGKFKIPDKNWKYLMVLAQNVMDTLPKFDLPGMLENPILTRIDIGSGLENVPFSYFVNEIEFVPSLYIEDQPYPVVQEITESLVAVAIEYRHAKLNCNLPIKTEF